MIIVRADYRKAVENDAAGKGGRSVRSIGWMALHDLIRGADDATLGVYEPTGKLPVSVPGSYGFGYSV